MNMLKASPGDRALIAVILAAASAAFCPSLFNGFVWDDWALVVPNEAYRLFDLKAIFAGKANSLEYLPVRDLSFALDARLWGMTPFGFHLTNLLLYLAGLVALFRMVRRLADLAGQDEAGTLAFWTTLVFALHPLHAEAVNFINARNTLLAGLFLFLSAEAAFRGIGEKRTGRIVVALVFYLLAVFSKAVAIFFPLFLLSLTAFLPRERAPLPLQIAAFLGFAVVASAAAWIHMTNAAETGIMNEDILRFGAGSWRFTLTKAAQIPLFYLRKLFAPHPLSVEYVVPFSADWFSLRVAAAGFVLAALAAGCWLLRRRAPMASLGIVWFLTALLPVLNLFPTHPVVADRYAYFAVAGFGLAGASLLASAAGASRTVVYPAVAVMVLWGGMSISRTLDWRSDIALWSSAVAADPGTSRINLAEALWKEGRTEEALSRLREERNRKGTHYASLYEGMHAMRSGRTGEAILSFQRALSEGGDAFRDVQANLAQAYEKQGDFLRALEHYLKALEARSLDVNGRFEREARDGAERMRFQFSARVAALRETAQNRPKDLHAQMDAALFLHRLGLYDDAEIYYRAALELDASLWQIWYNLGLTHMKKAQYTRALPALARAVTLNTGEANVLNNLGICYMHLKEYREAELAYTRALSVRPDFFYAAFNLGRLYFITGNAALARETFGRARALAGGEPALQSRIDQYIVQMEQR